MSIRIDYKIDEALKSLGIADEEVGVLVGDKSIETNGEIIESFSPVDGQRISSIRAADPTSYNQAIIAAQSAFTEWRMTPAPQRGEIVREIGMELRKHKDHLGRLVSYEMGKSLQEGWGEVQEMIDICDFATGLSRQLHGLTMHSERPSHRMYEQYHPLGIVGIISAFNFPVAVWSWNAMIAWVCGDVCIWKPSEKTPVTAIACQRIITKVFKDHNVPDGVSAVVIGDAQIGGLMANDSRVPLVSATGSIRMGKSVGEVVAARLGRSLLELGGNNAIIISEYADIDLAVRASLFAAVGTAGQRCTSARRLIIHEKVYDTVRDKLKAAYQQLRVGNPLDEENHVGPLIDMDAVDMYKNALAEIHDEGGQAVVEGGVLNGEEYASGCYVKPAVYEVPANAEIVKTETFAPILYLIKASSMDEAINIQNNVPQGLSSSIVTQNLRESEIFLSHAGSDCGIANVNIGTSGAEIGGAFGGEKETGGGRESGSDAWKVYMRRQTNTINYGNSLPLAQGIRFDV